MYIEYSKKLIEAMINTKLLNYKDSIVTKDYEILIETLVSVFRKAKINRKQIFLLEMVEVQELRNI